MTVTVYYPKPDSTVNFGAVIMVLIYSTHGTHRLSWSQVPISFHHQR